MSDELKIENDFNRLFEFLMEHSTPPLTEAETATIKKIFYTGAAASVMILMKQMNAMDEKESSFHAWTTMQFNLVDLAAKIKEKL